MSITRETLRLQAELRAEVGSIADAQVRDLVAAWAAAWDRVAGDLDSAIQELTAAAAGKRLRRSAILRSAKLLQALVAIQAELESLTTAANTRISADLNSTVERAQDAQQAIAASQLPPEHVEQIMSGWTRVDPRQVKAIVKRSTDNIVSASNPIPAEQMAVLRSELVQGTAVGDNPRTVAARILRRTQGAFNGGLARATTIARTEMLDANRAGELSSRLVNTDIITGWVWHCELSSRTCGACITMDGSLFPPETPGPDGHQNCRCIGLPQTKTWSDLGFPGIVEPHSMRTDARTQFIAMSDVEQKQILGPARFTEWKAGNYPMSQWSAVQHNPGWRDSVHLSSLPRRQSAAS